MKRVLLLITLLVFICPWTLAESSVWRVQLDGSVIYLGGTVHVLRDKDYPLPPEFMQAYQASDIIVFETDVGALQKPSVQHKMMARAMYADGTTVDQHVSPEVYAKLSAYCQANNIDLEALKQFKPSFIMTLITVMEIMKLGITQQGVDLFFYELANKDQKSIDFLETADEQIHYIVTMADGYEDNFVIHSLNDLGTIKQQYETIVKAWRVGDVETLEKLFVTEIKTKHPRLYNKLIKDRNSKWLPLISAYQKTPQTEFILVGLAHLVGNDGLIETLKRRGFQVDRFLE